MNILYLGILRNILRLLRRLAQRPFVKMSVWENVRSTKCPTAKCSFGKMSVYPG
jgi:hypothetical protein